MESCVMDAPSLNQPHLTKLFQWKSPQVTKLYMITFLFLHKTSKVYVPVHKFTTGLYRESEESSHTFTSF